MKTTNYLYEVRVYQEGCNVEMMFWGFKNLAQAKQKAEEVCKDYFRTEILEESFTEDEEGNEVWGEVKVIESYNA